MNFFYAYITLWGRFKPTCSNARWTYMHYCLSICLYVCLDVMFGRSRMPSWGAKVIIWVLVGCEPTHGVQHWFVGCNSRIDMRTLLLWTWTTAFTDISAQTAVGRSLPLCTPLHSDSGVHPTSIFVRMGAQRLRTGICSYHSYEKFRLDNDT